MRKEKDSWVSERDDIESIDEFGDTAFLILNLQTQEHVMYFHYFRLP